MTPEATAGAHRNDDSALDRLDSWKDIATYLKRDVSTVQRWERREGMPVHRHLHDRLGSVYAFRSELNAWRCALDGRIPTPRGAASHDAPASETDGEVVPDPSVVATAHVAIDVGAEARPLRPMFVVMAASLLAMGIVGVIIGVRGREPAAASPRIASLVVLPLANLSGDQSQDHLAAGLTEELTGRLAQLQALRVVSRTTALTFEGRRISVPDVARELDVDAVLEGSVRQEAGRVRVSVQLIHGPTDAHLWTRDFERDAENILALQAEVARAVADEIRLQVSEEERVRLAAVTSVNPAAYEEYLLGRHLLWKFIDEDRVRAMEHFNRAIALAPDYAAPYAGLAHAWWSRGVFGPLSMREVASPARDAAEKALARDARLAEAYAAKAYVQGVFDWDWIGAEATIRRGLEVQPNSLEAHYVYALLLMALGRLDESLAAIEKAARLDPLSAQVQSTFGRILYRARRFDAAAERLGRALELEPRHAVSYSRLGDLYEATGRYDDALEAFEQGRTLQGRPGPGNVALARVYARTGRERQAMALVPDPTADVYVALGDRDRAFARLFRAIEQRDDWPIFIKRDPRYDTLHADPRWNEVLRRMNLPIG